jgi:PAS domain S-box-containing protein
MSAIDILIVEDDPLLARELREQVEGLGYRVIDIARSGEEALEKTRALCPHIVLMNMRRTETVDGIQIGSRIRNDYDTPVIYMTDYGSQTIIRRAGATGPFGYIFRPLDQKQIFATIEIAAIRHQLESQLRQSRQWLNTTLTSIGDGVIATDEQGFIRFINPVAMGQIRWDHTQAVGKRLADVFSLIDEGSRQPIEILDHPDKLPRSPLKKNFEGLLIPRDGAPVPVEVNITSIEDGKGKVYGMVLIFRDVTEHREALHEIKRQANRAEALVQVAAQLNSHLELKTVLNAICQVTNQTIRAAGTAVLLQGGQKDVFSTMAFVGQDPILIAYQGREFDLSRRIFQAVLSRAHPVTVVQDAQNALAFHNADVLRKLDVQTLAIAALFRGTELIGALVSAFIGKPTILPEDEIVLLRGLADQASSAIENAELFEQVRAGREHQRKLAKNLVDIQEAERRHIAKELHDHLGQLLTGLQFMLESTKNQSSGKQRASLEEIQSTVSDIIGQVREMSLNLRPSMLDDMGLLPTLLWHLDRYTKQTSIRVNLRADEFPERLPLEIETAAYRIIQEALTNVARYAQVNEVFVGLVLQEQTLWVEVLDEGKGFDISLERDRLSSGISGMRERASLLGGYLLVESFINQGTQIVAALPVTGQPLERRKYDRNRSPGR